MQITEERRKRVIDLYFNQHKTYAEIAEIERMSPRDISPIVKEEQVRRQKYKHDKQQQEISSKAYKLFSEGKKPIEVAIALNLREPEATILYREYWKLKRLYELNSIYEEIGDDIRHIIELYRRAKKEGAGIEQILKLLQLADEDNASGILHLETRRKWLIDKIHELDTQIERSKNYLYSLSNEIANARKLLNDYNMFCEHKRQELKNINREASRIVTLVNRFKNNNEEYLKIKQTVEEEVSKFLTDSKVLLQFALASVIEAVRRNHDKHNNPQVCNISSLSVPAQQSPCVAY